MLQILNSSNKCTGHIPLLGDLKQLVQLLVGGNSLSSTTKLNYHVFDSLTNCTLLREIHMNSNQLANELPPSVANLSVNLQHLFKDWKSIKTLCTYQLRKVFFKGKIPNSIGKLQKLERLMVTDNLFSGEI